jgi:hypothetical protein
VAAIDVHAHHLPEALRDALAGRAAPPRIVREGGRPLVDCGAGPSWCAESSRPSSSG